MRESYPIKRKRKLIEVCKITDLLPEEIPYDVIFQHTVLKTLHKRNKGDPKYKQRNIDMFEKLYMAEYPFTVKEISTEYNLSNQRVLDITRKFLIWLQLNYNRRRI